MARSKRRAKKTAAKKAKKAAPAAEEVITDRNATGVLSSGPLSRDIHFENYSLAFHGQVLVKDTQLKLNFGRRYGLVGPNGCGKSTLLRSLAERDVPIPDHIDIHLLDREFPATDMSALEAVVHDAEEERKRLEAEAEELMTEEDCDAELEDVYERLDLLEADTIEARAAEILHGLGFSPKMQAKATRDFSGGWRMRIALARVLFRLPTLLLLDDATNHLDMQACVWLEEYLKKFQRILVVVSHSQDFLNVVCTNIIRMRPDRTLEYYGGNYDQYIRTRRELEENQMKRYQYEQDQIAHMKEYIARFGHGSSKLAKQAQSKEKTLAKMVEKGLTPAVEKERSLNFRFPECGKLPPPVIQMNSMSFGYPGGDLLYEKVDFGLDSDSRIALVGPNGVGKSTLLKLMLNKIQPTDGMVRVHSHVRVGHFHQHLGDMLDVTMTPLQFLGREFPDIAVQGVEKLRSAIGRYGLTGNAQVQQIQHLSDGQKARVLFAWLALREFNMALFDEPTNGLDLETIDALAEAINAFDGGLILVSHDFRLIDQVAKEIWVCENRTITRWEGSIQEYKAHLRKQMGLDD